jgi:transposase
MKKGHKHYKLLLYDIERGRVITMLPDRKKETLESYLISLPEEFRQRISIVTMDMWEPYYEAVSNCLAHAMIVIDRFHLMRNLNDALTKARRTIQRKASKTVKEALKGSRWLVVKNQEDLSQEEKQRLEQAFGACPELEHMYLAKEDFRQIFEKNNEAEKAEDQIGVWIKRVTERGWKPFQKFIATLHNWWNGIINYFRSGKLTNGVAEGINTKVKLLKRLCFGLTNTTHFKYRLLLEFYW